nr:acyl-homoserine lactone acylase QuiP-like [Nerophis lumbriciformis]
MVLGALLAACSDDPAGVRDIGGDVTRVIDTLEAEVSVLRVENDVAHIFAENVLDAHRVQGFVTAQDRYVQIELQRRFGAGTLAEVLGPLGLTIDATARGQGFKVVADQIWENLTPSMKERFEAYAEGVNAYIGMVKRGQFPVPEEIEIVAGLVSADNPADVMQPMTGYDVCAVAAVIMSRLGFETTDIDRQMIAQQLDALPDSALKRGLLEDVFGSVIPMFDIAEVRPGETAQALSPRRELQRANDALEIEPSMLRRVASRGKQLSKWIGKAEREFGSNSWAISSKGTGGGAILANDGHLSLTVPSLFYQQCIDVSYFGDDDGYHVCGLFFPGIPFLAVGTNGHIAWGQTYLDADVTDFYREQVRLGADGLPDATMFEGEWKSLERIDETYKVGTSEETIARWVTFDGRYLIGIEGELSTNDAGFFALGDWITPSDANNDSVVEAMSFDWTAFDVAKTLTAVDAFGDSKTVGDFKAQTRKLVGYAQNVIVADEQGDVLFTGYHALPCRDGLEKDANGWVEGANPQRVLDGTKYGAFNISVDDDGAVRTDAECTIPFDVGPRSESPASGFVVTANHDPLGNGLDNSLSNDDWYIGGPWALGYRAATIEGELAKLVASKGATVESVANVQQDHRSVLGARYAPMLVTGLEGGTDARFAEVRDRLSAWLGRGALAKSGVETFYASYSTEEKQDAVATMIFNAWLRRYTELVFDEPEAQIATSSSQDRVTFRALDRMLASRGSNVAMLASYDEARGESVLFDMVSTSSATETSDEVMQIAMSEMLDELTSSDYFGSANMDEWLWGLEHQVRFIPLLEEVGADNPLVGLIAFKFGITTEDLPLAENIPSGDPRASLNDFPRDGDWFSVDVASPGLSRRSYNYSHGPVMRMVIHLDDGEVRGRNVIPGGQSGLIGDEHFSDQAALWLGNKTIPLRYEADEAVDGATSREVFVQAR